MSQYQFKAFLLNKNIHLLFYFYFDPKMLNCSGDVKWNHDNVKHNTGNYKENADRTLIMHIYMWREIWVTGKTLFLTIIHSLGSWSVIANHSVFERLKTYRWSLGATRSWSSSVPLHATWSRTTRRPLNARLPTGSLWSSITRIPLVTKLNLHQM